jgi:hypothetical protein
MAAFIESLNKLAPELIAKDFDTGDPELRSLSGGGSVDDSTLTPQELKEKGLDHLAEVNLLKTELVVFLLFAGLLLGMLVKIITKKLKLPYTPFLTVAGVLIGEIDRSVNSG